MTQTTSRTYGWKPDAPDSRDHLFDHTLTLRALLGVLPASVNLAPQMPPVNDQGQLGSCTANAITEAVEYDRIKQGVAKDDPPSRLFVYYGERKIEGDIRQDGGAQIRDGIRVVASLGVCPESEWPYDTTKFAHRPPKACFTAALLRKVTAYERVQQTPTAIQTALAAGFPVIFGFSVYEAFESAEVAKTGIVPMPSGQSIGGHAVVAIGYDQATKLYRIRNSWGLGWGVDGSGDFLMPEAYLCDPNQASDMWVIKGVAQL